MTNTEAQKIISHLIFSIPMSDAEIEALVMAGEALEDEKWISVEEELPEDNQAVLVSVDRCFVNPIDAAYHNNGDWFSVFNDMSFKKMGITIFAWRPLPKIYKYWEDE